MAEAAPAPVLETPASALPAGAAAPDAQPVAPATDPAAQAAAPAEPPKPEDFKRRDFNQNQQSHMIRKMHDLERQVKEQNELLRRAFSGQPAPAPQPGQPAAPGAPSPAPQPVAAAPQPQPQPAYQEPPDMGVEIGWQAQLQNAKAKISDYDAVVNGSTAPAPHPAIRQLIKTDPMGAEILYHLAKNPQDALLMAQDPVQGALALGEIRASLHYNRGAAAPRVSNAPAPKPSVNAGGGAGASLMDKLNDPNISQAEYNKIRAQMRNGTTG